MTAKIDEKKWGKAMAGSLMVFSSTYKGISKEMSLGSFSGGLIRHATSVGRFGAGKYYFATGSSGGGGTLTPMMALDAAEWIREGILQGGRGKRYRGPAMADLSDRYGKWKNSSGVHPKFKSRKLMVLTGATAESIIAIKQPGGKMAITVNPKTTAPDPASGTPSSVKVTDYIFSHEYMGSRQKHQRPIISGVMAGWIAERSPAWYSFFRELMWKVLWDPEKKKTAGYRMQELTTLEGDVYSHGGSTKIMASVEVYADIEQEADNLDKCAKGISDAAARMLEMTSRRMKGGFQLSPEQRQMTEALIRKELSGSGISSKVVNELVKMALSGADMTDKLYQ